MKKRLVAMLLVLVMAVCAFPVCAFAETSKIPAPKSSGTPYTFRDANGNNYTIYTITDCVTTGSKGKAVRLVQSLMNQFYYHTANTNYYVGSIDGDFGPNTFHAVTTFQANMGLSPIDGIVGGGTWATLHLRWIADLNCCAMPGV